MTIADRAVSIITAYANDDTYGYDQARRWGQDFDCSSLVIQCYEQAGAPVKSKGATYTGNMRGVFLRCGFSDVTGSVNIKTGKGLLPGDVLLNYTHHTAMFIGGGRVAQARINELGTVTGGKPGDQTGREIATGSYYNYPWDCVLRYTADGAAPSEPVTAPTVGSVTGLRILRHGDTGEDVRAAQILLIGRGYFCGSYGTDGDFGGATEQATKNYQTDNGLDADGEIGPLTWAKLLGV